VQAEASSKKQLLHAKIAYLIENNGGIAMTTDMWKDEHKQNGYLSCTAHWIKDYDCSLQQSVYSAKNLFLLLSLVKTYEIKWSSTWGANMIKASQVFTWIPYSCHILNTILYHGFRMKPKDIMQLTCEEEFFLQKMMFRLKRMLIRST